MQSTNSAVSSYGTSVQRTGEFFSKLSPEALRDLSSLEHPSSYAANVILFSEKEPARGIFVVLEGEVKLSINSTEGKRLSLSIARKGDILGLSSALSGSPYEDDGGDALSGENCAHWPAGVSQFPVTAPRSLPGADGRAEPPVQHGLRAVAHGRAGFDSAGETCAPAAGVERAWPDDGMRNAGSVFTDA